MIKKAFGKNNFVLWAAVSAVVMLALPYAAVTFVKGDAGMAACFVLFFAVNPVYSVVVGAFAGKKAEQLWSLPLVSAALFLLGAWLFFDVGETAFILYAAIYFGLAVVAMLISLFIKKCERRRERLIG